MMNQAWQQIKEEPYRLFFPLGILIALLGVGHWPAYAFGWSSHYSAFFHSSIQTQVYMICFVIGFLMTAMPKFASAQHASSTEVLWFLGLILGNTAALILDAWVAAELCFAGVLIALLFFAKRRIVKRSSGVMPPLEFIWIPMAILHGIAGSGLMVLIQLEKVSFSWFQTAKLMSEQGFILCVVIGVGGFLAPRLMGTFRIYAKPGQLPNDPALIKIRKRVVSFHLSAGAIFFASFFLNEETRQAGYFLRAFIITAEYFWTCSYLRYPRSPDFYAKLIWISLWLVVTGSWLSAFLPQYRTAMLHFIFIGGFSLMIFSVASMVILSHGGEPEKLKKPLLIFWISGLGVAGSLGVRTAASFFPEAYFLLIGIAGSLWVITAGVWFCCMMPKTFKVLSGEELERCHEDSKQRVAQLRRAAESPEKAEGKCCGHKTACE